MNIGFGFEKGSNFREYKGKSLLELPRDYTLIDVETTGLDPRYDAVIEFCAIRVRNLVPVDSFTSLVNPGFEIDDFIIELTGITNEMLSSAPLMVDVFNDFVSFVGDDLLLGHNINFDINFLYDIQVELNNRPFTNNFVDTLRLSRRAFPNRKTNTLKSLAEDLNLSSRSEHRAEADCLCTQSLYIYLLEYITANYPDISTFLKQKQYNARANQFTALNPDSFDPSHPLFGKTCVFTGKLNRLTRAQAMQLVANNGGINGDSVTKQTNYLILGNQDYNSSIKDGKSTKHKKAEALILSGQDISIVSEDVFYDMIDSNSTL